MEAVLSPMPCSVPSLGTLSIASGPRPTSHGSYPEKQIVQVLHNRDNLGSQQHAERQHHEKILAILHYKSQKMLVRLQAAPTREKGHLKKGLLSMLSLKPGILSTGSREPNFS